MTTPKTERHHYRASLETMENSLRIVDELFKHAAQTQTIFTLNALLAMRIIKSSASGGGSARERTSSGSSASSSPSKINVRVSAQRAHDVNAGWIRALAALAAHTAFLIADDAWNKEGLADLRAEVKRKFENL